MTFRINVNNGCIIAMHQTETMSQFISLMYLYGFNNAAI